MEKLFNIKPDPQHRGRWFVKFANPPPEIIANELKSDKARCRWDLFRKHWVCNTDAQFIQRLQRDLEEMDWQRVDVLEATKAPLSATVAVEGSSLAVRFSRKPEQGVRDAVAALGVRDARNKLLWFVPNEPAAKQQLTNALARFPEVRVQGLEGLGGQLGAAAAVEAVPVSFSTTESDVTLHFPTGLPPAHKLHRMKGALQMLGYTVTDGPAPAQDAADDDDE